MQTKSLCTVLSMLVLVGCSQGEPAKPVSQNEASPAAEQVVQAVSQTEQQSAPQSDINAGEVMAEVKKLFAAGNYRAAFPLLDRLHAAQQCPPEGYVIRSQILDHSGLLSQSIASMTAALTIEPNNNEWHNMLGLLLVKSQNLPLAYQAFTKAIELKPDFSKAFNNRGLMFIAMKDYEKAINDFDQAIQHETGYIDAYNNRGYVYLEQGELEKAVENFSEAVKRDPSYVKGYNNRGFALIRMGQAEKAVEDFTKAIELSPLVVKHYLHRRDAWVALGNQAQAEKDQAEAAWTQNFLVISRKIQREPKNPAHIIERAQHYASAQKFDKALEDLSFAEKIDETMIEIYNCRASIHYAQKNYDEVVSNCTKALEYQQDFDARSMRGDAYLAMGKFDQAISDYTTVQRFDGTVAMAYWQRSETRRKSGDAEGAEQDRQVAIQLDPRLDNSEKPAKAAKVEEATAKEMPAEKTAEKAEEATTETKAESETR